VALGVLLLALAGWLYVRPSSFAQRAIITSAMIDAPRGALQHSQDGLARLEVYAGVHCQVGNERIYSHG
jgi:hypothetical protein